MCSSHRSARDGIAVFEVDLVADMECLGGALEVPLGIMLCSTSYLLRRCGRMKI